MCVLRATSSSGHQRKPSGVERFAGVGHDGLEGVGVDHVERLALAVSTAVPREGVAPAVEHGADGQVGAAQLFFELARERLTGGLAMLDGSSRAHPEVSVRGGILNLHEQDGWLRD